jgi:hypothetical protein
LISFLGVSDGGKFFDFGLGIAELGFWKMGGLKSGKRNSKSGKNEGVSCLGVRHGGKREGSEILHEKGRKG